MRQVPGLELRKGTVFPLMLVRTCDIECSRQAQPNQVYVKAISISCHPDLQPMVPKKIADSSFEDYLPDTSTLDGRLRGLWPSATAADTKRSSVVLSAIC